MTYQTQIDVDLYAKPLGLAICTFITNTTAGNDVKINIGNVSHKIGSFLTISNGGLVLPSGFFYYLEGATQFYMSTYPPTSATYVRAQWRTASSYIGSVGEARPQNIDPPDTALTAGDEKALALIDATQGSVTVWLYCKEASNVGNLNSTAHITYVYTGLGRATVLQLSPP
jgi:hypothetical protein